MLCLNCADGFVGGAAADRSNPAWRQVYRSVDHGHSKQQFKNTRVMSRFPVALQDFGNLFVDLQAARHSADYDPTYRCLRSDVHAMINAAEAAIRGFRTAPAKDRRALAAWILLRDRTN
jgi:hypothetical protein